jgi:MFS family permease
MSSSPAAEATPVAGALTHKQIVTILIGLMMGMFLAALDQTIVASAMRVIADHLQGLSAQAWVTTAYLITSTIATPLYGKLSDIYGRKPFFIAAITIFTIGSMLCTLATGRSRRWPPSGPSRASAPAGSSRSPWPSSATSCRRGSGPSTRATSWPSSAPRACSARSSVASSPAPTRSSASTAGAGCSSSTSRSPLLRSSSSPAPCTCTTTGSTTGSTGGARSR